MKKLFLLAAATFGMMLSASCSKNDDSSSEKTIKGAAVLGYVSVTSDMLQFGSAELMRNSTSLKKLTDKDTAFTFDVKTFPATDTLKLILKRDTTKAFKDTTYAAGYSYAWIANYVYSDGTAGWSGYGHETNLRTRGDSTWIIKYFKKSPVTIATFKFDEKGNFIPAN